MTTEKPYEQLLPPKNRDLVSPPSDVRTTLVGDSQVAVLDDSLPKTPIETPKKVNAKKDNPKSKATVNKKKPAKKKELSGKKATNRKMVSKSPKSKKAH
jgi:hypothetical protein